MAYCLVGEKSLSRPMPICENLFEQQVMDLVLHKIMFFNFNSVRPSDTYTHQQTRPLMIQIMACQFFGSKQLSELRWIMYSVTSLYLSFFQFRRLPAEQI